MFDYIQGIFVGSIIMFLLMVGFSTHQRTVKGSGGIFCNEKDCCLEYKKLQLEYENVTRQTGKIFDSNIKCEFINAQKLDYRADSSRHIN